VHVCTQAQNEYSPSFPSEKEVFLPFSVL
jgi:hypothetical protein